MEIVPLILVVIVMVPVMLWWRRFHQSNAIQIKESSIVCRTPFGVQKTLQHAYIKEIFIDKIKLYGISQYQGIIIQLTNGDLVQTNYRVPLVTLKQVKLKQIECSKWLSAYHKE